jgi:molybdopterin/thiamine biosynthesis adenylyltransferase
MKKCDSAVERMKALNDSVKYTALDRKLSAGNAFECFEGFDLIVDATDNFEAR